MDVAELIQSLHPAILIPASIVSEDVTLLAGLAATQTGNLSSWQLVFYFSIGLLLGNSGIYFLGTLIRSKDNYKWSQKLTTKVDKFFDKAPSDKIDALIVASRFLPGARVPTYLACGMGKYPLWKFHTLLLLTFWIFYACTLFVFHLVPAPSEDNYPFWINLAIGLASMALVAILFKLLTVVFSKLRI